MFKTFKISYALKNTYFLNAFIYSLKQIPLIGRLIPQSVYGVDGLKTLMYFLAFAKEVVTTFLGKFLYLLLMVMLPLKIFDWIPATDGFVQILFLLTLIGFMVNTSVFNPTKDKYYAVVLMRMNATQYAVADYWYSSLKCIVGMMPFMIGFGIVKRVPVWIMILFPFFVVAGKAIYIYYNLIKYRKSGVCYNENKLKPVLWILVVIILGMTYGMVALEIVIPCIYYGLIMIIVVICSIYCIMGITRYELYRELYQELLQERKNGIDSKKKARNVQKENNLKAISADITIKSKRHGFEYFNELFIKRHKKILWRPVQIVTLIALMVLVIVVGLVLYIPDSKDAVNHMLLTSLPYFVFVMYMINRGTRFTAALFMNCDYSMLTYNFYKKPSFILKLFGIRLRGIIFINLLPAFVIGIGMSILLYITGGTDQIWNYAILPVSIIALSVFFSVHYLTCYYLLQPYNIETDIKSKTYQLVVGATYFVSYMMMRINVDTYLFGIGAIVFCIAYCIIACLLVYKLAYKTFTLRN